MIYLSFKTLAQIHITGGDRLLEHHEHIGIHVDQLGVSPSDAALAHVALAVGHEAGQLQVGVRGSHLSHHLLEAVEGGYISIHI